MMRRISPSSSEKLVSVSTSIYSLPSENNNNDNNVPVLLSSTRTIKTLTQRSMKLMGMPDEFRYYQRMTNDPLKQSGVQFLTHYSHHHRLHSRQRDALVDWLHWGKVNGQAQMPHRHQRVAFDFNDSLHPTKIPQSFESNEIWWGNNGNVSSEQVESDSAVGVSSSFDPLEPVFNNIHQRNAQFTHRGPQQSDIRLREFGKKSQSLMKDYLNVSGAPQSATEFGFDPALEPHGLPEATTPGVNAPYLGEPDTKLMEAMSVPALRDNSCGNSITLNAGRYSKSIYINTPDRDNVLRGSHCRDLAVVIDMHTQGVRTKLVVLKAAQSGKTDSFCSGLDLQEAAHNIRMHFKSKAAAQGLMTKSGGDVSAAKRNDANAQRLLEDSEDYFNRVDRDIRDGFCLLWRTFSAARPLMTIINGTCKNIGNGIALFPKYAGLRDSSEFIFDGTQQGLTPFGGMTHLLARTETTLKYPGLAEFVMLTGSPLYSGDVLRLGWTDLFSTLPDIDYHIKTWFDDTEHMHNDAVAWQLGHLLDSCFKMDGSAQQPHSTAMERTSLTPTRSRWIEDIFADQPSVESILDSLTQAENLGLKDPNNTTDVNFSATAASAASAFSIDKAIVKLSRTKMHFALTPWDVTAPPEDIPIESVGQIFREYFFETNEKGKVVAARHDTPKLIKWREFRKSEYDAFKRNQQSTLPRHIFARVEGCEGKLVDFEFSFETTGSEKNINNNNNNNENNDVSTHQQMLQKLKKALSIKLGYPSDRDADVLWSIPTLDSALIRNDLDLVQLLHADPGLDDPSRPTNFPPIYFTVVRKNLFFSEWAYSVKHQLLLSSPFALKASLALLKAVRGAEGTEDQVKSVSESLALEFRFLSKMIKRRDFYEIGNPSLWPASQWAALEAKSEREIDSSLFPVLPNMRFDDVFERDVEIEGHKFKLRPRWEHKTVQQVSDEEIANLGAPLSFVNPAERTTEIHVPTETNMGRRVTETVFDIAGYEVVPGLGEVAMNSKNNNNNSINNSSSFSLQTDAFVPQNVNFYEMARHPWEDTPHSWRSNGFTENSQAYFEKKYGEAVKKVYDPENRDTHEYWPARGNIRNTTNKHVERNNVNGELEPEEILLRDRFWGAVEKASTQVEAWAREARASSTTQKFSYPVEPTAPEEKIYDDEYYRWFVRPGFHPNPSGVHRGGGATGGSGSSKSE